MKITFDVTIEELEKLFREEPNEKHKSGRYPYGPDNIKVWFNEGCARRTRDPQYNKRYLQHQQQHLNDLLRTRGHLFLNEVFDVLGLPRTKFGQVSGWVYEDGNSYIDFGLNSESNKDFINGKTADALLDFNVDGLIIDRI